MSLGVAVGVSTLSMTWMMPLLVGTSAAVTVAPFTTTVSLTVKLSGWPLTVVADMQSVTLAAGMFAPTTWYSRMSDKASLPSGVSRAARSMPASAKAWSVGAKTVNGPSPCRVSSSPACTTAETKDVWLPVHEAVRGMSFGVSVGVSTLSMTWMMPLLVLTSGIVTVASLTITPPSTVKASG